MSGMGWWVDHFTTAEESAEVQNTKAHFLLKDNVKMII